MFFWPGMALSWDVIRPRLTWMLAGLTLAVIAIPLFDRFPHDSSQRWWPLHKIITSRTPATLSTSFAPTVSLPDSTAAAQGWKLPFTALLVEIHLTLKRRWWYWLGCGITLVASLFVSQQDLKLYLLPLALILPTGIIADIGCREAKKDTDEMILTAPYIQKWYPIWKWAAGLIVSILPLLGPLAASTVSGQLSSAAALCVGIGFLVSLAVFSSVWTGDHRPFIILYTFLWWLMMNGIDKNPPRLLDWSGLWHEGRFPMVVGTYLLLTMLLIGLSLIPHRWNTFRK